MTYFEDEDLYYGNGVVCSDCLEEMGYDEEHHVYKCQHCGIVQEEDDLWDDNGNLDYDYQPAVRCPECGREIGYSHRQKMWICLDCGISYDEGDLAVLNQTAPDIKPIGCETCGNPGYPDCKMGCDAFDD